VFNNKEKKIKFKIPTSDLLEELLAIALSDSGRLNITMQQGNVKKNLTVI
jgi:hypothetical protein